jgi:hypothetical protein
MSIGTITKDVLELARLRRENALAQRQGNIIRRTITEELSVRLFERTEAELIESLSPIFKKQIQSMVAKLWDMEIKSVESQAHDIASIIFRPKDWLDEIINKTLPVLALNMARAGVTQLLVFGIDIRKSAILNRKQADGSEWIDENSRNYEDLLATFAGTPAGTDANIFFMTEMPEWMKKAIMEELARTFTQTYWEEISVTTQKDAERVLRDGLSKGWSTTRMAREMSASLGGSSYGRRRALRIARTEAGNVLNSIRNTSLDRAMAELGPVIPIKKVWLSVLSDATRASHANLDGVPADGEGLWNLDGVKVPYPSHTSLPPQNRVNCMCTIHSELGVTDEEARQLIAEHEQRVAEINAEVG